jgi:hypothetical protein
MSEIVSMSALITSMSIMSMTEEMERNMFRCFVPDVILFQIFSGLLSLKDVCRFDSAICNRRNRSLFLGVIGSCVFLGDKDQNFSSRGISWLKYRSIRIRQLRCSQITDNLARKIAEFGSSLYWISINGHDRGLSDTGIIRLAEGCPRLHSLDVGACGITDIGLIRISEMCPDLHELNVAGCEKLTDASIIRLVSGCPNLCDLDLSFCLGLTDSGVVTLSKGLPNMTSLKIGTNNFTDVSVIALAEYCHDLQILHIGYCPDITDDGIITLTEGCPKIRNLDISCDIVMVRDVEGFVSNITDASVVRILDAYPDLHSLFLNGCIHITDVNLIHLAEKSSNINSLHLSDCCDITDAGIICIAESCHYIEDLDIDGCENITDASITRLAEGCRKIQLFTIGSCGVTDIGMIRMAECCLDMRVVYIHDCPNITALSKDTFREGCDMRGCY